MQCVNLDSLCSTFTPIAFLNPISRPSWRCIEATEAKNRLWTKQFTEEKTWGAEATLCEWHANWEQGRQLSTSQPSNQITECRGSTLGTCVHTWHRHAPSLLSTSCSTCACVWSARPILDCWHYMPTIIMWTILPGCAQLFNGCRVNHSCIYTYTANVYMPLAVCYSTYICCSCPADQSTAVLHQWHSSIRKGH